MPPVALRPRSTTELIDAAVQLMRRHYVEIVTASAIFLIPAFVVRLFLPDMTVGKLPSGSQLPMFIVGVVLAILFSLVSTAAVVVVVSDSYLGREVSVATAFQRVIGRFWSVIGVALLQSIITGLGILLFIVPGVLCAVWLVTSPVVVMVEAKNARDALSRASQLARGSFWRIFGLLLLTFIILGTLYIITAFAVGLVGILLHANAAITALLMNIVGLLIYPFFTVVITLLYYDLRIRKEGFDLEMMSADLAGGGPAASPQPV